MALFKESNTTVLHVGGMHCPQCVARVNDALEAVDGVTSADVNFAAGTLSVSWDSSLTDPE